MSSNARNSESGIEAQCFDLEATASEGVPQEVLQIVASEERALAETVAQLKTQLEDTKARLSRSAGRARELTSQMVATTRDEDRALLASDEAVSHAMAGKSFADISKLEQLIKRPYFARFTVEELKGGKPTQIEYRIGFMANPDCRILDWKKAPVARLYYEYGQGDEYFEEIQGIEREGRVLYKVGVGIEDSQLNEISCRFGRFFKENGEWVSSSRHSLSGSSHLPDVLALITKEQFHAITEAAERAIFIQGVAGSGKTTVALYRLAWLINQQKGADSQSEARSKAATSDSEEFAPPTPERCLILVSQRPLRNYLKLSLEPLGIPQVEVLTYREWASRVIRIQTPHLCDSDGSINRPDNLPPPSVSAIKDSLLFVKQLEETVALKKEAAKSGDQTAKAELESWRRRPELAILASAQRNLVAAQQISTAGSEAGSARAVVDRCKYTFEKGCIDSGDDALLLRAVQLLQGGVVVSETKHEPVILDHIVADEVQDLSAAGLASVLGAVRSPRSLTLVGDLGQRMEGENFPLWQELSTTLGVNQDEAAFFSLNVSHRSTEQIMRLANEVGHRHREQRKWITPLAADSQLESEGERASSRSGRTPIIFTARTEQRAVGALISWLSMALEKYPTALTALLCADRREARDLISLLRPSLGSTVRLGDGDEFSFSEGVVVTDIRQVKGLEFANVALWNINSRRFPDKDVIRKSLYVALTRAQENLALFVVGQPSPTLPKRGSSLLRFVSLEQSDEE